MQHSPLRAILLCVFSLAIWPALPLIHTDPVNAQTRLPSGVPAIVFVSRAIPNNGTVYWSVPNDLPGVGPYSRFRVAAPGRLIVLEPSGATRVLVDGGNPTAASLNLIDVNAPDVSYDGKRILFAGFSSQGYNAAQHSRPLQNPNGWRLYVINADGTGLRQITRSDQSLNYSQFGSNAGPGLQAYDDTDPAWLPDGRIVFSSTRWPSYAQYGGVRTSNLFIVNADGAGLHRITSERNGADRPSVDPVTGQIVFSRWWRNHRFATDDMATVAASGGGFERKDGLTADRANHLGGFDFLFRNTWHLAVINPDGSGLEQWAGPHQRDDGVHAYGGAFTPSGDMIANYFPMQNMTEAAGFGGLRRYKRRKPDYEPLIGVTKVAQFPVVSTNPPSYGVYKSDYATEPAVLADGRILFSLATGVNQDYALYLGDANGQNRTLIYDRAGTTEVRARLLQARPTPPIVSETAGRLTNHLPPRESGPYDAAGTFVFDALNVYANGPVDTADIHAPKVGSAKTIRFFADFQRTSPGSYETLDWPILLADRPIAGDGSVRENAPAGIPLFEQIRSADGKVPMMGGLSPGAAHVAGMNYGVPGQVARCVGCHSGHTQIPVPATDEEAKWTNLAPGAEVRVSSSRFSNTTRFLNDRRVMKGHITEFWNSAPNAVTGQWVELVFPEPVTVRTVRLYNLRRNEGTTLQIQAATVRLGAPGVSGWTASQPSGALSASGTDVTFADVRAQTVRVELDSVSGLTYDGVKAVALAEIEVIARAGDGGTANQAPVVRITSPVNGASVTAGVVKLTATAVDPQEGDISAKIVWRSNVAGEIGRGASISPTLAMATHTITATATDSGGNSGSASIALIVNKPAVNERAKVTIVTPERLTKVSNPVTFTATAIDPEDGDISDKILWHSNLGGQFGIGKSITATLPVGTQSVTALVKDSGGLTAGMGILITVENASTPNTPPKVTILTPQRQATVSNPVAFSATAIDEQDGDISDNIIWHSNLAGQFARGRTATATLPAGTQSVTALLKDSGGLTGGSSVSITVQAPAPNAPPKVTILSPTPKAVITGPVTLRATAIDPEDGDITSQIIWHSNIQGQFVRGGTATVTLQPGTHNLTALVKDSGGRTGGVGVTITVVAQTASNLAPAETRPKATRLRAAAVERRFRPPQPPDRRRFDG